jgi:hypothetical protein
MGSGGDMDSRVNTEFDLKNELEHLQGSLLNSLFKLYHLDSSFNSLSISCAHFMEPSYALYLWLARNPK